MILNLSHQPLISPLFYARNLNRVDLWHCRGNFHIWRNSKVWLRGEGGIACNFVSHLRFCGLLLRPKQPSSLNWQVFIRWHILPLVSILRRWRKRRCSIGNSILGRPPPPSHPSRAEGHQPICHLLPPTIPPSGIFKVTMPLCNCSLKLSSPGVNLYHKEFNQLLKRTDFELDLVFDKRVSSCWGKLRLNPDFRTPPISAVVRDGMSVISENHRLITAG